jgi:hypothetical protein
MGFFNCSRGVRQGDPLSTFLFCLAEDILNKAIALAHDLGRFILRSYCRGITLPTHILYADDIIICCTSSKRNVCCHQKIFNLYYEDLRQLINYSKSKMYTGTMTSTREHMIANMFGFSIGAILFQYLGCPISKGNLVAFIFS